jgi:hypothetical protein
MLPRGVQPETGTAVPDREMSLQALQGWWYRREDAPYPHAVIHVSNFSVTDSSRYFLALALRLKTSSLFSIDVLLRKAGSKLVLRFRTFPTEARLLPRLTHSDANEPHSRTTDLG